MAGLSGREAVDTSGGDGASAGEPPYRARLFGHFGLVSPNGTDVTPPGRKARALLAHLLVSAGEPVSRERLAGLLWSGRAEEQARASLRQAFHEIRPLTSGDRPLIVLDRAQALIAGARVVTDLDEVHRRIDPDGESAPTRLFGSRLPALLSDLNDIDPGFDEWLASERRRQGDVLRTTVLLRAGQALGRDDAELAGRLAIMLLSTDPLDEAAARYAMQAAHRRGDKGAVRLIHTRLVQALQAELGVPPATETSELHRQLMETAVPTLAMASPVAHDALASPVATPEAIAVVDDSVATRPSPLAVDKSPTRLVSPWTDTGRRGRRVATVAVVAAAALAVTAVYDVAARFGSVPAQRLLAVEPLLVAANDGLARLLDRGLSTDLARMIVGNDALLSVTDAVHAGASTAGAQPDFTIGGDAQSQGGMLRADVKLRRGDDKAATILWSHSYSGPAAEIDALREQIATNVADVAVCALGRHDLGGGDAGTETMRLYLAACEQQRLDADEAKKLLTQVVAREPGFAHGWAMLAVATALTADSASAQDDGLRREADTEARRALAIDPKDGEAYVARAAALPGITHWSARQALLEAGHAVDPGQASVDAALATELGDVGRLQEALVHRQRSWAFDPFSGDKAAMLARAFGLCGDIDDANAMLRLARKRFPANGDVARTEFWLAAVFGDVHHAIDMLGDPQRGFEMLPIRVARWRPVLAARLDPSPAKVNAAVAALLDPATLPTSRGTHFLADLVRLGRTDLAFALGAQMTANELDSETDVLFSTVMAPLRADRRFMRLAAHAGLTAIWLQSGHWPDFCGDQTLPYDCRTEALRATTGPASAALHVGA